MNITKVLGIILLTLAVSFSAGATFSSVSHGFQKIEKPKEIKAKDLEENERKEIQERFLETHPEESISV